MSMTALGILAEARAAIGERARTRDVAEERSMARAVAIHNAIIGCDMDETGGWLFMVALKLARSQQGAFHQDDFVDAAAYCALAGECAAGSAGKSAAGGENEDALNWRRIAALFNEARDLNRKHPNEDTTDAEFEALANRYNGAERTRKLYDEMLEIVHLASDYWLSACARLTGAPLQ